MKVPVFPARPAAEPAPQVDVAFIPEASAFLAARDRVRRLIAEQASAIAALKALDAPAVAPAKKVLGVAIGAAHIRPLIW